MQVIAIDPAPGKNSTIFDGREFLTKTGHELRSYLNQTCNRTHETLLCWDAPLTGPADPRSAGIGSDFTQRLIESFFRQKSGFKIPEKIGISVREYSACPHWMITRSLLGLPRTGPYDLEFRQLPFRLLPAPQSEQDDRNCVVEIHPAVAAWLWCKQHGHKGPWKYKGKGGKAGAWQMLWRIVLETTGFSWCSRPEPSTHDQFDAAVSYILGRMYVEKDGRVAILGDRCTGSFLLPVVPTLKKKWREFLAQKDASIASNQLRSQHHAATLGQPKSVGQPLR